MRQLERWQRTAARTQRAVKVHREYLFKRSRCLGGWFPVSLPSSAPSLAVFNLAYRRRDRKNTISGSVKYTTIRGIYACEGGSVKLGTTPGGGGPAGIWERSRPARLSMTGLGFDFFETGF